MNQNDIHSILLLDSKGFSKTVKWAGKLPQYYYLEKPFPMARCQLIYDSHLPEDGTRLTFKKTYKINDLGQHIYEETNK